MSVASKIRGAWSAVKALGPGQMRFPGRALVFFDNPGPDLEEMARDIGDGTSADVLMTPIRWLQRSMLEAPVTARDDDGELIENSDLVRLLRRPNPEYSWEVLLAGAVMSLSLDGNAYWLIVRNANGKPVELWFAPHTNIEPRWPSDRNDVFISHYRYQVANATPLRLEPDDVIHFREGLDPHNIRKGLSPLRGLLREVWTDNEAAIFTAALLKNGGVPGVVISPADKDVSLTPEEAEAAEARITSKLTGRNRGKPLVMTGATKVEQFGFSPKDLDLSPLRDISEERVTAALGVPAAVVGFGSGLQSTRVGATMRELRQLAWFNGIIPMQRIIAGEITRMLAPAFNARSAAFDNTRVEALRENEDTKAARVGRLFRDSVITRAEARSAIGLSSVPADEVFSVSLTSIFVPQGAAAPAIGNGNGKALAIPDRARIHTQQLAVYRLTEGGVVVDSKRHTHDPTEERIIGAAPSRKPTTVAASLARRLDRIRLRAPGHFADRLATVFSALGRSAGGAAARLLEADELAAHPKRSELKQDALTPADIALANSILDAIDVAASQQALAAAFEQGFLGVALEVDEAMGQAFGLATSGDVVGIQATFILDDAAQRSVMLQGGLRAGLIDLDTQTRDALFDALVSGRERGLTADNLARHIRGTIEAGPWRDVATRARVIARSEGGHAANVATLQAARDMPETEHVQVFDDRIGFGDEACMAADGSIITIDEAEVIGLAHPNCTRAFVPVNAVLMEEMNL